ncbi:hypothetical protein PFBG_03768 [Plasmodium falciparum 7G8]|uniref:Uncharacterized protein n=1 Tax=Plasmodium falciparum (isolate 7G8) TaxID=57266 RepID=W7FBW6_PLAF8|nr:hypothetical protein PFBG_03768 [Plasmodium falciparum 7G8]
MIRKKKKKKIEFHTYWHTKKSVHNENYLIIYLAFSFDFHICLMKNYNKNNQNNHYYVVFHLLKGYHDKAFYVVYL